MYSLSNPNIPDNLSPRIKLTSQKFNGFTNYERKNLILGFCNHHSNTYIKNFLRNKQVVINVERYDLVITAQKQKIRYIRSQKHTKNAIVTKTNQ